MRCILAPMLFLAIVGVGSLQAAEIPDDIRAEFPRAEKENQDRLVFLQGRAKEVDRMLHAHDVGRTHDQALALIAESKKLHAEIDARNNAVPPAGLWGEKPPEVGRIGTINLGKIKIERVIDKESAEAILFANGRPRVSNLGGGVVDRGTREHGVGEPFVIVGVDTSQWTTGAIIDPPAGPFRVGRIDVRGATLLELSAYSADDLRTFFDQLKAEKKHTQRP